MARQESKLTVHSFNKGLHTDFTELNSPQDISIDEDNCSVTLKGNRKRRLGVEQEAGSSAVTLTAITATILKKFEIANFQWTTVGGDGELTFKVVQVGNILHFFDNRSATLSLGVKSFTIDLLDHNLVNTDTETKRSPVSMASGRGALFIVGKYIEPFFVEYRADTDTISTTTITIEIRDLQEQSPTVALDLETATPTEAHVYDLLNQGWYVDNIPVEGTHSLEAVGSGTFDNVTNFGIYGRLHHGYFQRAAVYPAKNKSWWNGKKDTTDNEGRGVTLFSVMTYKAAYTGNTIAPLGHYILNAFDKDRTAAVNESGPPFNNVVRFASLPKETQTTRPTAVSFFAGRVWYGFENTAYFSQLVRDDMTVVGRCYQEADPTSAEISDLIATDGGTVPIPEMGNMLHFSVFGKTLILFADNGAWTVGGSLEAGFSATEFTVANLTLIAPLSAKSVVEVDGFPVWWSNERIYSVGTSDTGKLELRDLTDKKIRTFYNAIPSLSKRNASGNYDAVNKIVTWTYRSTDAVDTTDDRYMYDRVLSLDLNYNAFYPSTIDTSDTTKPYIAGVVGSKFISTNSDREVVFANDGTVVLAESNQEVTVQREVLSSNVASTKFLTFEPAATMTMTFAEFRNTDFLDWAATDYTSFIDTFYHLQDDSMTFMQAPYVYVYSKQTETIVAAGSGAFNPATVTPTAALDASYVSDTTDSDLTGGTNFEAGMAQNMAFLIGEDGKRYYLAAKSVAASRIWHLVNAETGVVAHERTPSDFDTDCTNNGLDPTNSFSFVNTFHGALVINDSPYMIAWGADIGADLNIAVLYYKINVSGQLVVVGGLHEKETDATDQFPTGLSDIVAVGRWGEGTDDDPIIILGENNKGGDAKPNILLLPSITDITNTFTVNAASSTWSLRKTDLSGEWGDNFFSFGFTYRDTPYQQRGFFLPKLTGSTWTSWVCAYVGKAETEKHIDDAPDANASTYIETQADLFPDGFLTVIPLTKNDSDIISVGTVAVDNTIFQTAAGGNAIPFADVKTNKDDTAGVSGDDYMNPNIQRIKSGDQVGLWLALFPKVYYDETPDLDPTGTYVKVEIFLWDPANGTATLSDSIEGSWFDTVDDLSITRYDNEPQNLQAFFDVDTGAVSLLGYFKAGNPIGQRYVVADFGTLVFADSGSGVGVGALPSSYTINNQSSLLMQARWDWATTSKSNKFGASQQVYKFRQPLFIDDDDPEIDTGYEMVVTKNKVRGKGRALQLRFTSETGKDFEIIGWAIWFNKNAKP